MKTGSFFLKYFLPPNKTFAPSFFVFSTNSSIYDQVLWNKAYDAWETRANGVIYKDHPLVTKVRLMMQDYQTQDVEKIKRQQTKETRHIVDTHSNLISMGK